MGRIMTVTASDILADLTARGIELVGSGNRIRYRPRSLMAPELVERIKAHKPDLLAILRTDGIGDGPEAAPEADIPERPAERPGYVTELISRDGRWSWRQRRMDEADRAWAAYHAATSDE